MARPAFTGFAPFKHLSLATTYDTASAADPVARKLNKMLNRGYGSRKARAVIVALTGAAVGAASKAFSYSRVNAGASTGQKGMNALGGARTIETVTPQSGVTVAADLANFDTRVAAKSRPSSYPRNASGYQPGKINSLMG